MSVSTEFSYDLPNKVIHFTIKGPVVLDDLIAVLQEARQHPDFDPSLHLIADFTQSSAKLDPEDVKTLGIILNEIIPPGSRKHAVVVEQPRTTALALLYQNYHGDVDKIQVFNTYKAAVEWIMEA